MLTVFAESFLTEGPSNWIFLIRLRENMNFTLVAAIAAKKAFALVYTYDLSHVWA